MTRAASSEAREPFRVSDDVKPSARVRLACMPPAQQLGGLLVVQRVEYVQP
jgi:hypothetical protein